MKKYLLEITVFICWAVVMIFELVWSRVLWPYLWTSIFVWTSLIWIILWSLSLWYYLGWKISDKKANLEWLSLIIFFSGVFIILTIISKYFILNTISWMTDNLRISSIIASAILFAPTSILLWIISPYVAKLKIKNIATSWTTVWNLYALSTAWSIFGTFLAWFFLIPFFWTNNLLTILAGILIILSIIVYSKKKLPLKIIFLVLVILIWLFNKELKLVYEKKGFIDLDTAYSRIWIFNRTDENNKKIKSLLINNEHSSAIYLENNELVYEYTKYYHLAKHFFPDFKNTLMLWWAWYSFPKSFLNTYSWAKMDVVEIDPKMTELAKKYFNLKDNKNLHIYHEDWRVYLNKTKNKYDVVFWDAFSSHYSIPYQLTTKEAIQKTYDALSESGVVILNIISSIEWEAGQFLQAEYKTYKSIFPQVYIFPVREKNNWNDVQNIILVALKSDKKPEFYSSDLTLNSYLDHLWKEEIISDLPILTDDYAPVDYYINKTI